MNIKVYTKTENFIKKMNEFNLSSYGLAKIMDENASTMSRIKDGKISVKINAIKKYCDTLNCGFDDIFYIKQ